MGQAWLVGLLAAGSPDYWCRLSRIAAAHAPHPALPGWCGVAAELRRRHCIPAAERLHLPKHTHTRGREGKECSINLGKYYMWFTLHWESAVHRAQHRTDKTHVSAGKEPPRNLGQPLWQRQSTVGGKWNVAYIRIASGHELWATGHECDLPPMKSSLRILSVFCLGEGSGRDRETASSISWRAGKWSILDSSAPSLPVAADNRKVLNGKQQRKRDCMQDVAMKFVYMHICKHNGSDDASKAKKGIGIGAPDGYNRAGYQPGRM